MVGLTKKKVRTVGDVRFPDLPIVGHQMEIKTTDGKERALQAVNWKICNFINVMNK